MSKKRGNMSQFPLRMQVEFDREEIVRIVANEPGITMLGISKAIGKAKSTAHQQTAILIANGRVEPVALGKRISYYVVAEGAVAAEHICRADYPNQATIAAIDKAKDIPAMDPLLSALFGRATKETA